VTADLTDQAARGSDSFKQFLNTIYTERGYEIACRLSVRP